MFTSLKVQVWEKSRFDSDTGKGIYLLIYFRARKPFSMM